MEGVRVKEEELIIGSSFSSSSEFLPQPIEGLHDTGPPPFLTKTFDMVEDPVTDQIVSWSGARNSFVVWDAHKFTTNLLPKHFKHSNFSSFIRQLNTYGFRKVDPDRWEFANESFLGGQRHLLKNIKRRRNTYQNPQQQQAPGPCVELGQFGIEHEVDGLQRDRNSLMVEIVKLRQQQHHSRTQLAGLEQRLQSTERKQKQMMIFLAKALKNPTFIEQLMHRSQQMKELGGLGKKRRLPASQSGENLLDFTKEAVMDAEECVTSETDIDILLSVIGGDDAAVSFGQESEVVVEPVESITGNEEMWQELLSEELPAGFEEIDVGGDQHEVDVEVEDLVEDWGEDVKVLVEQMGFLGGSDPCESLNYLY